MLSDMEIIRRVREGRIREFHRLIDRYQGQVFALAFHILGRREEAEDAVQDTFVSAYQGLHKFIDGSPLWPWLRRIAVNCCLSKLPREFPTDEIGGLVENEQPFVDSVQSEAIRNHDCRAVTRAVAGLPSQYRIVVVLRYHDDLTPSEIADLLDEPAGTIRVRLHRALKMLFERLAVIENEL